MAEEKKKKKLKFVFTIIQCRRSVKLTIEIYVKVAELKLNAMPEKILCTLFIPSMCSTNFIIVQ